MVADSDADDIKFFMDEPFCPFNQVHHRQSVGCMGVREDRKTA